MITEECNNFNEKTHNDISSLNTCLFSDNDFIIMHVNIRSLNKNVNNLHLLLEELKVKPDIIVCTETRKLNNVKYYSIPNYNIEFNNSTINQNDGTVMLFKKKFRITKYY